MAVTPARQDSLIHAYITTRTGMALSDNQRRRLDERLAVLRGSLSEQQYLLHLQSPAGAAELSALVSVVAVHKTDLFRDEVQLGAFRTQVLEPLVAQASGRPLRVWSAGCATGEEVATLLIMLEEAGADGGSTVLGTDISEAALNRARTLCFSAEQVRRLPALFHRYFMPDGSRSLLVPELRERAMFQHHNLMETPYPAAGGGEGFDVIFCRNVLIYFTSEAFSRVVGSLAERLGTSGTLVLSAAEPLLQAPPSLRIIRSEQAFFYVRTPSLLAAQPGRPSLTAGLPSEPPSGAERKREAGSFSAIMPPASSERVGSEPKRDSQRLPAVGPEPKRDSQRLPAVGPEPKRDSQRLPAVGPEPRRDSGRFPSIPAEPRRDSGRFPTVGSEPRRDSGRFPAVPAEPLRDSGRFPTVGSEPRRDSGRFASVPSAPEQSEEHPLHAEADGLFALVLDGVGETDSQTEDYLRRCLALDPDLSAARYLLGMMLELREEFADAATEYRRALRSLAEGKARPTPFFLNHSRLRVACEKAIERMEGGGKPR
ncbi:MAG: CheR family methyltransferase [Hyalangium sp.]|uniref:CheR family methyltransferase n=1 Tax=Hyalangium sp. TaxID=2028555 RepID=UPI00389A7455